MCLNDQFLKEPQKDQPEVTFIHERDLTTDVLAYIGAGLALLGFLFFVVLALIAFIRINR